MMMLFVGGAIVGIIVFVGILALIGEYGWRKLKEEWKDHYG